MIESSAEVHKTAAEPELLQAYVRRVTYLQLRGRRDIFKTAQLLRTPREALSGVANWLSSEPPPK
jgi:hypothetical protein